MPADEDAGAAPAIHLSLTASWPAEHRNGEQGHEDGCGHPEAQGLRDHGGRPEREHPHVVEVMSAHGIGSVLVLDQAKQLLGIVSERDIVRSLTTNGGPTLEMTAGQLMTRAIRVAHPGTTVEEAMAMMTVGRFRHLPVIDHGVLVGLISIGDVVKARIMQQAYEVDSLRAYVAGAA